MQGTKEQSERTYYQRGKARRDPCVILGDDRTIKSVHFQRGKGYTVGENGVTEIVAYGEPGQMAKVPFIAVYKGSEIATRVPAHIPAKIKYFTEYDEKKLEEEPPDEDIDLPF
jgi:hypothetical protein